MTPKQLEFDLGESESRNRVITAMENFSRRYLGKTWTKKEINKRVNNGSKTKGRKNGIR